MIREINTDLKYVNSKKCIDEYRNIALVNKETNKIDIVYKFIDEYTNYDMFSYVIYMMIMNNGVLSPRTYNSDSKCNTIFDFDKYYVVECNIENMKMDIDVSLKRDGD